MPLLRWFTLMVALMCVASAALIPVHPAHTQTGGAGHNREAIAENEIEQRMKLDVLMARKAERDGVIKGIIDERDKVKEAKKSSADLTSTKIDQAFAKMSARMHVTPEWLTKSLEERGVQVETLKDYMRAEVARAYLTGRRYRNSQDPDDIYRDPYYKYQDPPTLRQ